MVDWIVLIGDDRAAGHSVTARVRMRVEFESDWGNVTSCDDVRVWLMGEDVRAAVRSRLVEGVSERWRDGVTSHIDDVTCKTVSVESTSGRLLVAGSSDVYEVSLLLRIGSLFGVEAVEVRGLGSCVVLGS